jgi:hypothetical protein
MGAKFNRAGSDWKVFPELDIIFMSILAIQVATAKRGEMVFLDKWKAKV